VTCGAVARWAELKVSGERNGDFDLDGPGCGDGAGLVLVAPGAWIAIIACGRMVSFTTQ
jgi:hypothetical protein